MGGPGPLGIMATPHRRHRERSEAIQLSARAAWIASAAPRNDGSLFARDCTSRHRYKYRLYYGRGGVRLVGYDNERGKGDHRHLDGVETLYDFTNVDRLVSDFLAAVRDKRRRP